MMDWQSTESLLMLNPQMQASDKKQCEQLFKMAPQLSMGHLWLSSSGSTRQADQSIKLTALSKLAFLVSAQAVNGHLRSTAKDCWLLALPNFHVGGLSVYARAHLSGAQVIQLESPWSAPLFHDLC